MDAKRASPEFDVSVIVPCRNEGPFLQRCLESILASDYAMDKVELLVGDGRSTDGARETAEAIARERSNMRVIDNPGQTAPAALNRMVPLSRGKYILRFDAHSEMPPDYIRLCVELLESTGAWNVGGGCRTLPGEKSPTGEAIAIVTTHPFGVGNSRFRIGGEEGPADTAVFGAYPREVFERIGLFDERLVRSQDYEFNARIRKSGGVVWFSPRICVTYYCQTTIKGLCRQGFRNGMWVAYGALLAPYSGALRHFAPAVFTCGVLIAAILMALGSATGHNWLTLLGALVPLPYGLVWAAVSLSLLHAKSPMLALRTALIFPVFHFSYGCGTLWGALSAVPRLIHWRCPGSHRHAR